MSERGFDGQREETIDPHDQKVQRISRDIGGYYRQLLTALEIDIRDVFPVRYFPQEVWNLLGQIRRGAHERDIRLDPYLSGAFETIAMEDTMIAWEVVAQSPEIALYASGDLGYAQDVRELLQRQEQFSS